jgi:hypothetical protein
LAGLTSLTNFGLGSKKATGLGLKALSDAKNLKQLYMNCPKFTDAGLKEVAAFKGLALFQLFNGAEITEAGVKELAALTKLQSLDLSYSGVTDGALKELTGLKELTRLVLTGTKVTDAGVKEVEKALPKCKVVK